jgi:hypothetical protein
MMNEQGNFLIIDENKSDTAEFVRVLRAEGYEVERVGPGGVSKTGFSIINE